MFDLKLDVMEDQSINIDPVEAFSDFIISQEELNEAEQELFEINRAYENLTALQEVVAKHGWNEVLNDLVGDQVSAESLDSSCEGVMDKIKGAVKKVGKAAKNFVSNYINAIMVYLKRFEIARKWLKSHAGEETKQKISSEVLGFEGKIYHLKDLSIVYSDMSNPAVVWKIYNYKQMHGLTGDNKKEVIAKLKDHIEKHCHTVNYNEMSPDELEGYINLCVRPVANAFSKRALINKESDRWRSQEKEHIENAKQARQYLKQSMHEKNYDNNPKFDEASDTLHREKNLATYDHENRFLDMLKKQILHLIYMSCVALDKDLKRRGFKSEF